MKTTEMFLDMITNSNTRTAMESLIKKMKVYMKMKNLSIYDMEDIDIDMFIKTELNGKSDTTISATISRLKNLFNWIEKPETVSHLSLNYVKSITKTKESSYLTPSEVYNLVEGLINYQDKALILLCYIGLYDNNFDTIRNLRIDQFDFINKLIKLDSGELIKISNYCSEIFLNTVKENEVEKYVFQEGRRVSSYKLNENSPYILKSKERKGGVDILPPTTLKKRIELFGKWSGIDGLTAIMIKNSRVIYDIVKLEYETNYGMEINQVELKNVLKDNNVKGTIELLNMSKKILRVKMIKEIIDGKTAFIDV